MRTFKTRYGEVTVKVKTFNTIGSETEQGIEIKGERINGTIELLGDSNIEAMTNSFVESLIDRNV